MFSTLKEVVWAEAEQRREIRAHAPNSPPAGAIVPAQPCPMLVLHQQSGPVRVQELCQQKAESRAAATEPPYSRHLTF